MKLKLPIFFALFLVAALSFSANAQDYAASVKVSTTGINLEAIRSFSPNFNIRLGTAFFSYNINMAGGTKDDYSSSGDLKLLSFSALTDWFPFESSFRLTAGFYINLNNANVVLTPKKTYYDGNIAYTPEKLGTLNADIKFNKVDPYIGIGFGNPTAGSPGFGFTVDIGTFYHGNPKASMTATKLLQPSATQGPILEQNLKWFKFYPVLSLGLTYKF